MSKNDKKVAKLQKLVSQKRKELGEEPEVNLKTTGTSSNVQHVMTMGQRGLALLWANIKSKKVQFEEATAVLGIDEEFKYMNFSFEDWDHDIRLAVSVRKWREEEKVLNKLEKELDRLLSEEARTASKLSEIEDLLK